MLVVRTAVWGAFSDHELLTHRGLEHRRRVCGVVRVTNLDVAVVADEHVPVRFLDWYAEEYGVVDTSHLERYSAEVQRQGFGRKHSAEESERSEKPPEQVLIMKIRTCLVARLAALPGKRVRRSRQTDQKHEVELWIRPERVGDGYIMEWTTLEYDPDKQDWRTRRDAGHESVSRPALGQVVRQVLIRATTIITERMPTFEVDRGASVFSRSMTAPCSRAISTRTSVWGTARRL